MTLRKRIATLLLSFLLLFVIGGETILSAFGITASAETVEYSNVLDDLQKDEKFDVADYPAKANDYSLQVIQIAEGENGELFVYVYQPNFPFLENRASYINIAFQDQRNPVEKLKYERRSLTFLNSNGVFCKYLLNDFVVEEQTIRYYSVATIYRPYIDGTDKTYESIDLKQYVGYKVGKMWAACLYNDVLQYGAFNIDTVKVEITASGDIYYPDGLQGLYLGGCNSHYFVFKVDGYDVTEIFDADVTYNLIPYLEKAVSLDPTVDETREKVIVESKPIYKSEEVVFEPDGLFGKKATWKRIQTVDDFLADVEAQGKEFTDTELADIKKGQFVFRVAESNYNVIIDYVSGDHVYHYYRLEDSGVLRLHFATPSGSYNLGAVSDLVGTDGKSDTKTDMKIDFEYWFEIICSILMLIVIIFIVVALWDPIKALIKFVFNGLKALFDLCVKIIVAPFRFVGWLLKK